MRSKQILFAATVAVFLAPTMSAMAQRAGPPPPSPNGYDVRASGSGPHSLDCPNKKSIYVALSPGNESTTIKLGKDCICVGQPAQSMQQALQNMVNELMLAASPLPWNQVERPNADGRINSITGLDEFRGGGQANIDDINAGRLPSALGRYFGAGPMTDEESTILRPRPGYFQSDTFESDCYTRKQLMDFMRSLLPYIRRAAAEMKKDDADKPGRMDRPRR